jgi:LmbE family N-acetylglucosaminyl deacetylase
MRQIAWIVLLLCGSSLAQSSPRTLLAVFAHPDDETLVGPVLARYAREGAKVYLAIATRGEKGTNERAGIPAGDSLANVRRGEAICACKQLGIEPPIFFELSDGELGAIANPLGHNTQVVADRVEKLIEKLHPAVVVTWGAEGGYGHPDHRLVSDAVTQVIQASKPDTKLYYIEFSPEQVKLLNEVWPASIPWHATDTSYLTVSVAVSKADQQAYHRALECHKSQFSPEEAQKLASALDMGWQRSVLFRPWFGQHESSDLFK